MNFTHLRLLAQFRGLPLDAYESEPMALPLDGLLDSINRRYAIDRGVSPIVENWSSIIGEKFAISCHPASIDSHGALVIAVNGSTLREELRFQERRILRNLQNLRLPQPVTKLRWQAG